MAHLTTEELTKKITDAEQLVKPGDLYYHYKDSSHNYKVISLCLIEATDDIGVLYQPLYDGSTKVIWMRPIQNFLEEIEIEGKKVKRFQKK